MKNMSLSTRVTSFVIALLILCAAMIGVFAYFLERSQVIEANADRALAIARTVSAALDAEQYIQIMDSQETNDYYEEYIAFLDETLDRCGVLYLYLLDSQYGEEITYFADGILLDADPEERLWLGDTEHSSVFPDEIYETMDAGVETTTDVYDLGGYGAMVSAHAPILDSSGKVIGVVGVDLPVQDVLVMSDRFGLIMILMITGLCIAAVFVVVLFVRTYISKPVQEITAAADLLAQGRADITVQKRREDEIGKLADAFSRMIHGAREQSDLIERLANGDLTVDVRPRGEHDTVNLSLSKMATGLHAMITELYTSIHQVTVGSKQLADGSHSVAQGSAQQSASVEQLSDGMHTLASSIEGNADKAGQAVLLSATAKENAEKGSAQMQHMLQAVKEINDASSGIGKVMKVIDDIAFQTNILALNAAVEAARAGVHGKGFAVVAAEVRNLAAKSAAAARDSEDLISNSMEKAALGARIAEETSASLRGIVEGINQSAEIVNDIARAGDKQVESVNKINTAISQVSDVVQHNSAAAEQSAAAAEQMNGQATLLREMVSQFKVEDNAKGLPASQMDMLPAYSSSRR